MAARAKSAKTQGDEEKGEDEAWEAAQAALDEGDRLRAESAMRAFLLHAHDTALRERAELRLAELLLARGAFDQAKKSLEPLVFGANPSLAADAVWLYARSFQAPEERANAWSRYLATSPSVAMQDVALVQRATALVDAGDLRGAKVIINEVAGRELAPVAAEALRRLESREPFTPRSLAPSESAVRTPRGLP